MATRTIKTAIVELLTEARTKSAALAHIAWRTSSNPRGSPYYKGPHVPPAFPYVTYDMIPGGREDRQSGPADESYSVEISIFGERDDDEFKMEAMADPTVEGSLFHFLDQVGPRPADWISGPKFKCVEFDRTTAYDLVEDELVAPNAKRVWIAKATYEMVVTIYG